MPIAITGAQEYEAAAREIRYYSGRLARPRSAT